MNFENCQEMLSSIGTPVEMDILPLNKKAKSDTSVSGNIIAFDPDSKSIGLLQFHKGKPSNVVYIPGGSFQEMHDLSDGPFDDDVNYQAKTEKLCDFIDSNFLKAAKSETLNHNEITQRRQKLETFFESSSVQFKVDESDGTIIVGAVKIRSPYSEDSCFSENQLALGRLRKLITQAFA